MAPKAALLEVAVEDHNTLVHATYRYSHISVMHFTWKLTKVSLSYATVFLLPVEARLSRA